MKMALARIPLIIASFSIWIEGVEGVSFTTRPGIIDSIHPGFSISSLLPPEMPNKVIGMDWLPNGDLAILAMQDSIWLEYGGGHGWVYVVEGAKSTSQANTKVRTIYYGFEHPMGLAVGEGNIYVSQRESLVQLVDQNGNGLIDTLFKLSTYPKSDLSSGFGRWAMSLRYSEGRFYTGLGAYHFIDGPGPCLPSKFRGRVHVTDLKGETFFMGQGLRVPNGIGLGPEGEIYATDNDGEWVAANKLVHVQKDEFYGLVPCETREASLSETSPPVWFPHHLRSPGQPLFISTGLYQGQMLVGDYVARNLSRIFLEKVNGRYQGALFPFTGGLEKLSMAL